MQSVQKQMKTIENNSEKLLNLYFCKEERQKQFIRETIDEMRQARRLREYGILQAKPTPQAAASQDPTILDIQPSAPSPSMSIPSSLPNLKSVSGAAAVGYNSVCEITANIPPKRKRIVIKPEPIDPDMQQIEAGVQNLL